MNKNFNEWYLELAISLQNGQLNNRWAGVEKFSKNVTADDIINLVKVFYNIQVDEDFIASFSDTFVEFDAAFSRKSKRELSLLAGAVLVEIADANSDYYKFTELLVKSVSFGNRNPAVIGIYQAIEQIMNDDMIRIRDGKNTDEEILPVINSKSIISSLSGDSGHTWTSGTATAFLNYINSVNTSITKQNETISAIRESKNIYFEDSQLLWWLTAGWSKDFQKAFKLIDVQMACLVIGKEAAELVKLYPGPYSIQGVLHKMIENSRRSNTKLDFIAVIHGIDNEWKHQYNKFYNAYQMHDLLPISTALLRSENTETKDEWVSKYSRDLSFPADDLKCSPLEYALQMYFEVLTLKCYYECKE
jgi:hypothetical protein